MKTRDTIERNFNLLKNAGLKAKNPDQSAAMFWGFQDLTNICRNKGFRKKDIQLMFKIALKQNN